MQGINQPVPKLTEFLENTIKSSLTLKNRPFNGLFIYGTAGTGKSLIIRHLYRALCHISAVACIFEQVPELLLSLRDNFSRKPDDDGYQTESQIIDHYTKNVDYLFLDDLGAEKPSAFTIETLYIILDRCERNLKPVPIITSNFNLSQLSDRISDRIASRLSSLCEIVKLQGADYRVNKQSAFILNADNTKAVNLCQSIIDYEIIQTQLNKQKQTALNNKPIIKEDIEVYDASFIEDMHKSITNIGNKPSNVTQ